MRYKKALARFKSFGTLFCDDRNEACDYNCDECELMESAIIEALEKQIPKRPKIEIYKYPYGYTDVRDDEYDLVCPCCGEDLVEGDHHCKCGQAIDISEVD